MESRSFAAENPTLHPWHLHSIPPPGTQAMPECRALALGARAQLQPLCSIAPGLPQHTQPCTQRPHTHFSASLSKSLLEVNIYIYCKWLIGNTGLGASLGWGRIARANCSPPHPSLKAQGSFPAPWQLEGAPLSTLRTNHSRLLPCSR